MFFENKAVSIKDVFYFNRKAGNIFTKSRSFSGLAFRLSGESVFLYSDKKVKAETGSITYIPSGLDFEIRSEREEIIILHLDFFGTEEKDIISIAPSKNEIYAELFSSINDEWSRRKSGYKSRCTGLLYKIFENLEKDENEITDSKTELIKKGLIYMNTHFDKCDLSIKTVAEKCNLSEVYFRKIYKSIYGISPLKAVNELRLKRACELLKTGYYTVNETAALSGFSDVKYFGTAFKNKYGVTPGKFK